MNKGAHPVLTIAMPVFNAGTLLRMAVLSLLKQSFRDWELLLIDDGSTDGAIDCIKSLSDPRIRILRDDQNKGLAARLNQAISLARGRYFARMDQDDICHPDRLNKQIEFLEADKNIDLLGVRCIKITQHNKILGQLPGSVGHEAICQRPWLGFYLPHPTWMGRTDWFRQHQYLSPGPYCTEDQELLLRTHASSRFHVLPEILLAYRVRGRINLKKNIRTRVILFWIQVRYFLSHEQYWFLFLSGLVAIIKIGFDTLTYCRQLVLDEAVHGSKTLEVSQLDKLKWQKIIDELDELSSVSV